MVLLDGTTAQIQQQIDQNELTAFNNNFYAYTAKECTIYDVLSVVNMAKSFNEQEEYSNTDTEYYINVTLDGTSVVNSLNVQNVDSSIKAESNNYGKRTSAGFELTKYYAEIETSTVTGRVRLVRFTTS